MACAEAHRDRTLWLLLEEQQNGDERLLAMLEDLGHGYDGRTLLMRAVGGSSRLNGMSSGERHLFAFCWMS